MNEMKQVDNLQQFSKVQNLEEQNVSEAEAPVLNEDIVYETWQKTIGAEPLSLREKRHGEVIHGDLMNALGVVNLYTHTEYM